MDPSTFGNPAASSPVAADPTLPITGAPEPGSLGETSPPGETAPTAAAAPITPTAPPTRTYSEAEYTAAAQKARQFDQVVSELQSLSAQQQQAAQEKSVTDAVNARLSQAYQAAETMEPTAAFAYIRRIEEQERANYEGRIRETRQRAEAEKFQLAAQLAAPLYAQELAQRSGLPADYAQRLAMLPAQQMDIYLPVLVREYQQAQELKRQHDDLKAQLDQLMRTGQAQTLATNGAHPAGGTGMSPMAGNGAAPPPGSREHLLAIPGMADAFGIRR